MTLGDTLVQIARDVIERTRRLSLDYLTPFGLGTLRIGHPEGKQLTFSKDGVFYGDTEIGTSGGAPGLWETDGVTTSLITPQDVNIGDNELKFTNSGNIRLGPSSDCIQINHDGAGDHRILTTNDMWLEAINGMVQIFGDSLEFNNVNVLTDTWDTDVDASDQALNNLLNLNFGSLGGVINKGGVSQLEFQGGVDPILLRAQMEAQGLVGISGLQNLSFNSQGYLLKFLSPTLTASQTFRLPGEDGTAGQAIVTDGAGNLSFSDVASGDGRVYIDDTGNDATSIYFDKNPSTGNLVIHLPTGKGIEYAVG